MERYIGLAVFFGLHIILGVAVIIFTVVLDKWEAAEKQDWQQKSGMISLVDEAFDKDEPLEDDEYSDSENSNNIVMSPVGRDGKFERFQVDKSTKPRRTKFTRKIQVRVAVGLLFLLAIAVLIPVHLWVLRVYFYPFKDVSLRIIGAVDDSSAKLFCREPSKSRFFVQYRPTLASTPTWSNSATVALTEDTDWTGVVTVSALQANTSYDFRYVFDDNIEAAAAQANATSSFRTTTTDKSQFTLAFGSCVVRTFPNVGGDMVGYGAVHDQHPDFFIQIGDQIYSDIPNFFGTWTYLPKYRDAVSQPDFQRLASSTPTFQMYDDHEIVNDWSKGTEQSPYPEAMKAWDLYAGNHNPRPYRDGVRYYSFNRSDTAFFVLDTRAYRSDQFAPDDTSKTMLGITQLGDLFQWLDNNKQMSFKFIVSTVAFSLNTQLKDSWYGYQNERTRILDFIAINKLRGVTFLSGDLHYAAVWKIADKVYEFSASPIDAFVAEPSNLVDSSTIFQHSDDKHFGFLTVNTVATPAWIEYKLFAVSTGAPVYNLTLTTSDI